MLDKAARVCCGPTDAARSRAGRLRVHAGTAFRDVKGVFYPTVGMRTPGEVMLANFGQRPFRFDIEAYVKVAPSCRASRLPFSDDR
mgnify:CR=1 FL=1